MIGFMIYMMNVCDNISIISCIAVIAFMMISFGIGIVYLCESTRELMKIFKTSIFFLFISGIIATFVPDGKTIAAMYVVPSIVNNEKVQNVTSNSLELLEKYTKKWLDEITNKTK